MIKMQNKNMTCEMPNVKITKAKMWKLKKTIRTENVDLFTTWLRKINKTFTDTKKTQLRNSQFCQIAKTKAKVKAKTNCTLHNPVSSVYLLLVFFILHFSFLYLYFVIFLIFILAQTHHSKFLVCVNRLGNKTWCKWRRFESWFKFECCGLQTLGWHHRSSIEAF